jgi:four helix bundle protein
LNYREWEQSVSEYIKADAIWRMKPYRLSLFAGAIGWHDITKLAEDRRTISLADQSYRALGSIGANLAEGYSRNSGKDRARYYEYALGSARESRHWYAHAAPVLTSIIIEHRLNVLSEIIRLLIAIIPKERQLSIKEDITEYIVDYDANIPI